MMKMIDDEEEDEDDEVDEDDEDEDVAMFGGLNPILP